MTTNRNKIIPDAGSARANGRRPANFPDEDSIARGLKRFCQIERGGRGRDGKVLDEHGILCWRYGTRENPTQYQWSNPFHKADFVFTEAHGATEVLIRRVSFIPSIFHIIISGQVTGRIRMASLLRNRYVIEVNGLNSWTFMMPLFTVRFHGGSTTGTDIWVIVGPSKMEWNILIRPPITDSRLLAALSFIHNEWWS